MKSAHNSVATIPMEIEQAQGLYFIEIKTDNSEQVFLKLVCEQLEIKPKNIDLITTFASILSAKL